MAKQRRQSANSSENDEYWRLVLSRRKRGAEYPFRGGSLGFKELMQDFLGDRIRVDEFQQVFERHYSDANFAINDPAREHLYQVVTALQDYTCDYEDEPRETVLRREIQRVLDECLG